MATKTKKAVPGVVGRNERAHAIWAVFDAAVAPARAVYDAAVAPFVEARNKAFTVLDEDAPDGEEEKEAGE